MPLASSSVQWCLVVTIRYRCSQQMSPVIAFDIAVVAQKVKVQYWGPVWSEKVDGCYIRSRSGWLWGLLSELTIRLHHNSIVTRYSHFYQLPFIFAKAAEALHCVTVGLSPVGFLKGTPSLWLEALDTFMLPGAFLSLVVFFDLISVIRSCQYMTLALRTVSWGNKVIWYEYSTAHQQPS